MKKIKTLKLKEALIIGATLLFSIITLAFSLINGFGRTDKVLSAKAEEVIVSENDGMISENVDVSGLEVLCTDYVFIPTSKNKIDFDESSTSPLYTLDVNVVNDKLVITPSSLNPDIYVNDPTGQFNYYLCFSFGADAKVLYTYMGENRYLPNEYMTMHNSLSANSSSFWLQQSFPVDYSRGEFTSTLSVLDFLRVYYDAYVLQAGGENAWGLYLESICDVPFSFYFCVADGYRSVEVTPFSFDGIVRYLTRYSLPTSPVKEGYTFKGWYSDEACTSFYNGNSVLEDTVLYAGWEKESCTITFDYGYGENIFTQEVLRGESAPAHDVTRTGYNFIGWYYDADFSTIYDNELLSNNTTLYAKWEIQQFKVTFIVDGNEYATVIVPYGSKFIEVSDATLLTGDVKAYTANSVLTVANEALTTSPDGEAIITNDVVADVTLEVKTFDDKAKEFFGDVKDFFVKAWDWTKEHWVIVLCSFLGVGLLIAVITSLVKSKKF